MSHLSTTLHVDASPEIVFDLVADPARGPEWQTLLAAMGEISGRPGGVGSSYTGYYGVAGRRLAGRFVITAAERPTIHQAAGTTRGGWARWTTFIEPAAEGSDVRVTLEYELPGEPLGTLFGMLTGSRLQGALEQTYANLKRVAEADASRLAIAGRPGTGDAGAAASTGGRARHGAA